MSSECVIKGPYYPVGDVDFTCQTHNVTAVLRDPARYGAGDLRLDEVRCPVGEPEPGLHRLVAARSWTDPGGDSLRVTVETSNSTGEPFVTFVSHAAWLDADTVESEVIPWLHECVAKARLSEDDDAPTP